MEAMGTLASTGRFLLQRLGPRRFLSRFFFCAESFAFSQEAPFPNAGENRMGKTRRR
jgi:hypothetical protein